MCRPHRNAFDPQPEAQGIGRLVIDAIVGVTNIVESMHRNIAGLAPLTGPSPKGRTRGVTGLVYRTIRGLSRLVGDQLDTALARLAPLLSSHAPSTEREAVVAALNGLFGDHLVASNNPLALPLQFRIDGRSLTLDTHTLEREVSSPSPKLLVLVHGLCMNDRCWSRHGHNHGLSLARALGYTPLFLRYNSGRPISTNGRRFAARLDQLVQAWPTPVRDIAIIGHSMGGLVARSACHYGELARYSWLRQLGTLVFLGTPHHGAPLERAGSWIDALLGASPYTAPFARIGAMRSAGVKDLRYGTLVAPTDDEQQPGRSPALPTAPNCFALAATTQRRPSPTGPPLPGDGLVPVPSALGQHAELSRSLALPTGHRRIVYDHNHFDLLGSREVYDQIQRWLTGARPLRTGNGDQPA